MHKFIENCQTILLWQMTSAQPTHNTFVCFRQMFWLHMSISSLPHWYCQKFHQLYRHNHMTLLPLKESNTSIVIFFSYTYMMISCSSSYKSLLPSFHTQLFSCASSVLHWRYCHCSWQIGLFILLWIHTNNMCIFANYMVHMVIDSTGTPEWRQWILWRFAICEATREDNVKFNVKCLKACF